MKVSILIPAYNEARTLVAVVEKTLAAFDTSDFEIIVVDDGSADGTFAIASRLAATDARIRALRHETNRGKGRAIRSGLAAAAGDYIAIQDADLEYEPRTLRALWDRAEREGAVVYGVRRGDAGYAANRLGNRALTLACNLLFGSALSDIYTCYKLIPRSLADSLALAADGFEIEAELTAKLLKRGVRITETPIPYAPRTFAEGKHIRWTDGLKGLATLARCRFSPKCKWYLN